MLNIVKLQEGIPQFHNVNPGLINHGFLTRGVLLQLSLSDTYMNGTLPIKQPFGIY